MASRLINRIQVFPGAITGWLIIKIIFQTDLNNPQRLWMCIDHLACIKPTHPDYRLDISVN
jgi:hypothetical protein